MAKTGKKTAKKKVKKKKVGRRFDTVLSVFKLMIKESDRGCVVAAGGFLDEMLEELLRTHLVRMSREETLVDKLLDAKAKGALGSFGVRIKMAVAMGLVAGKHKSSLEKIGEVRNEFSHNPRLNTLERKHISKIHDSLDDLVKECVTKGMDGVKEAITPEMSEARVQFVLLSSMLVHILWNAISDDKRRLRIIAQALEPTPTCLPRRGRR